MVFSVEVRKDLAVCAGSHWLQALLGPQSSPGFLCHKATIRYALLCLLRTKGSAQFFCYAACGNIYVSANNSSKCLKKK